MSRKLLTASKFWIVLARSHRALSLLVEQSIAEAGLCLSDFMVIEALLHKGPLTITEIQQKVLLALGSMTVAVDRLEAKGLIIRKYSSADRRVRVLQLTAIGRKTARKVFKTHAADLEALTTNLSQDEMLQTYSTIKMLGLSAARTLEQQQTEAKQ